MTSLNHPDKVSLDAYSDPQLQTYNGNGVYSRFTNVLQTPILNAKGIQLLNANFINSRLQLDDNSQLMFWYYQQNGGNFTLRCIRLHPSSFVPLNVNFTAFTRNRYFNSVDELTMALNNAASSTGDSVTFNPFFTAGQIAFFYDTAARRISFNSLDGSNVAPAAFDDPAVIAAMRTNTIVMNSPQGTIAQPNVPGFTMNPRIGFARSIISRPLFPNLGTNFLSASSTGLFQNTQILADANPILLGTQNVGVYCSVIAGSGMDFTRRKNLLETIPVQVAPLNVNNYTLTSLKNHAMSVPNEIYEITIELLDDRGLPFIQPPNFNTQISLAILY